jgi:hypothetical protein
MVCREFSTNIDFSISKNNGCLSYDLCGLIIKGQEEVSIARHENNKTLGGDQGEKP